MSDTQGADTPRTVEDHATALGTSRVWFVAAKQLRGWPVGLVIPESEFRAAVTDAQNVECR